MLVDMDVEVPKKWVGIDWQQNIEAPNGSALSHLQEVFAFYFGLSSRSFTEGPL